MFEDDEPGGLDGPLATIRARLGSLAAAAAAGAGGRRKREQLIVEVAQQRDATAALAKLGDLGGARDHRWTRQLRMYAAPGASEAALTHHPYPLPSPCTRSHNR